MTRALALLLWLGVLLTGVVWINRPRRLDGRVGDTSDIDGSCPRTGSTPLPLLSSRALVTNHRLVPGDLVRSKNAIGPRIPDSAVVGHFLVCAVPANAQVGLDDIRPVPELRVATGHRPYLIRLDRQPVLIRLLDPGARIDVWRHFRPVLSDVPVVAVVCFGTNDQSCAVAIDGSPDRLGTLANQADTLDIAVRSFAP